MGTILLNNSELATKAPDIEDKSMSGFICQPQNASWIELDSAAFQHNVKIYQSILPYNVLIGAMLKGNAYGHGFSQMLNLVYQTAIDVIFVINPYDALYIREFEKNQTHQTKRVIVLGAFTPEEMIACLKEKIELSFGEENYKESTYFKTLKTFYAQNPNAEKLKIHLHLDTGLSREGMPIAKLDEYLPYFKENLKYVHIQAVMSHFASVGDEIDQTYAIEQLEQFEFGYEKILHALNLTHTPEKHIAQSTGALVFDQSHFNLVRIGISLYGYYQSSDAKASIENTLKTTLNFKPILTWKVKSQSITNLPTGSYIGYGCTYRTLKPTRIALLPVGYADGYSRKFTNSAHVLVNGTACNVLGRVMMNYIVIDITNISTNSQQIEATLVGKDGDNEITVEMLASWAQTSHYEILTQIGAHLKRIKR